MVDDASPLREAVGLLQQTVTAIIGGPVRSSPALSGGTSLHQLFNTAEGLRKKVHDLQHIKGASPLIRLV